MEKENSIAATAADFQAILTNELESTIKKAVFFYIDKRDPYGKVSSFNRTMIAENAWGQVIAKRDSFSPGNAKFRTWAKKVAENKASDEIEKLFHDASHYYSGALCEEQPKNENDAKKYDDRVSYYKAYGQVEDSSDRQYWIDAYDVLKSIVANYGGRDREIGEMVIRDCTKDEMMAQTGMSGGNVDVCKSRVLKKMRTDLLKAGYCLDA